VTLVAVAFPLSWPWALITLFISAATLVLSLRRVPRPPRWWWWLLGAGMFFLNIELLIPLGFIHQVHRLDTLEAVIPALGLLLFLAAQAYLLARLPKPGEVVGRAGEAAAAGGQRASGQPGTAGVVW
jgi:hypothetical protein